jgi:flavin reductase (DIM6/NTAB) family NADH-FMN oxidoreductase RutF
MSLSPEDVPLAKAYRLLNHGPTVLVTSAHSGTRNVMAAAWAMPLDFQPPKVLVVIAAETFTRHLVEASGEFALNVPPRSLARATVEVGTVSGRSMDKFQQYRLKTFSAKCISAPLVEGCIAWLECKVIPNAYNQSQYDLFVAEVVSAQADPRVFADGRWKFEYASEDLRTIHHVAGGHFYSIGDVVNANQ